MSQIRYLIILALFLLSTSSLTSFAQNDSCSVQEVLFSFTSSALSSTVDAWLEHYASSECDRQVITGSRTMAVGFDQLASTPFGTIIDPCSQVGILKSFESAALSGEIETWIENYNDSTCPNEAKRAANTLFQGYLQLIGEASSQIAFISNREGNYEIYTMNNDGTELRRLTRNDGYDGRPDWSPDGTKIVFTSDRDGNSEIYAMSSNGRTQVRLTNDRGADRFPTWSPDGSQILFDSNRDGDFDIYIMSKDGLAQQALTRNSSNDYWPSWSPDGTKILYASGDENRHDIYIMNADGSGSQRLTSNPADDIDATFSPDGQTIAFISNRTGTYELYFMSADGLDERLIPLPEGDKFHPDWNLSGTQLVIMINPNRPVSRRGNFRAFDDGEWELYLLDSDGSNPVKITNNSFDDGDPDWGP